MSSLRFIKDTIYSLKRDYGLKIAIGSESSTVNLETGIKTPTYTLKVINRAILLPTATMASFIQAMTNGRAGTVEKNTRMILVDKKDVGSFNFNRECFIGYSGNALDWANITNVEWNSLPAYNASHSTKFIRTDAKKIEDVLYAITITVQETNGLTIL